MGIPWNGTSWSVFSSIYIVEYRFVVIEKALIRKLQSHVDNFENWLS